MATDTTPVQEADSDELEAPAGPRFSRERLSALLRRRHRLILGLILVLAAFCNFYELQREGFANLYYSAAVRSMLESWHNFFFVSFDPGGFVTVDKPPLGFWIETASAKLLGYSGFSILLPEALAGIASVGVLYVLVRRLFGVEAGLLSALFLAITPVSVVTNRNNTIDSLLVLTVLLAAYVVSRAVEQGSLRWMLLCALLVGLGFNIKMLEAYLVVPAFALTYLLAAPVSWWKRLWHLVAASGVLLVVSLSWIVAVDWTPASARPYVGSSGSNSELALALGYNGIERLLGTVFRIGTQVSNGTASIGTNGPGGPGGSSENGAQGIFRLLNAQLGGQASWLLALGLVGAFAMGWGFRPRGWLRVWPLRAQEWRVAHLTTQQAALVLWGTWTLTMAVFFSIAGFFHRYYLSMLAPGIAALAGIGLVLLWRDYRNATQRDWHGFLLPVALVMTAFTQAVILADYSGWNSWMTPLIVGGSLIVAGALVAIRVANNRGLKLEGLLPAGVARLVYTPIIAVALGVGLLLVGPATWTGVSLASGNSGTLPAAGPTATTAQVGGFSGGFTGGAPVFQGSRPEGFGNFGPSGGFGGTGTVPGGFGGTRATPNGSGGNAAGLQVNSTLLSYLEAHQGSAKYLFATMSSMTAAPYIIETGKAVMALGGFSGSDQILTVSQLQALIRGGQVHYFVLSGGFGGVGGVSGNLALVSWVESHGTTIAVGATTVYYVSSAAAA